MAKPKTHIIMSTSRLAPPHLGHVATITAFIAPTGRSGQVAVTACGRAIKSFIIIDDTCQTYTDGSTYWKPCPACKEVNDD